MNRRARRGLTCAGLADCGALSPGLAQHERARRRRIFRSAARDGRRPRADPLIGPWDELVSAAGPADRDRRRWSLERRVRARVGGASPYGAAGRHRSHLEAGRPGRGPAHSPHHGRDPGALPDPGGLRHRRDRDRARVVRAAGGGHGHRLRPRADRDGAANGPVDGVLGVDRLRRRALRARGRLSKPIAAFMGEPRRRRRWWSLAALTFAIYSVGLDEPGRVHARDEVPQHRAAQLARARDRGASSRSARRPAGRGRGRSSLQQVAFMATFVAALWWRSGWRPDADVLGLGVP